MATTLADEFLADFDGLSDEEEATSVDITNGKTVVGDGAGDGKATLYSDIGIHGNGDGEATADTDIIMADGTELSSGKDVHVKAGSGKKEDSLDGGGGGGSGEKDDDDVRVAHFAKLLRSEELNSLLSRIETSNKNRQNAPKSVSVSSIYELVVESNRMATKLDEEILTIFRFVQGIYAKKFPELAQLVPYPLDYIRVVKLVGNAVDLTTVPGLNKALPNATVMIITVSATTTSGTPLSPEALERVIEGCDEAIALDGKKMQLNAYVESCMATISPNLTVLVGPKIGARLLASAGGLPSLSRMDGGKMQSLGKIQKDRGGMATSARLHHGHIWDCSLVQGSPPSLQSKTARLVAYRVALCARTDAYADSSKPLSTAVGEKFRSDIEAKIEKALEPPPVAAPKPLPAPDEVKPRRRGGKRVRKMKEHLALTEMRKLRNRMEFGVQEATYGLEEKGFGLLGSAQNMKKLQVVASETSRVKMGKKTEKRLKAYTGSSGSTSGLSSSLAFTPVQGLELENPMAALEKVRAANAKWFGSGFKKKGEEKGEDVSASKKQKI